MFLPLCVHVCPSVCVCVLAHARVQVYEAAPCYSECGQYEWRIEPWSICTISAVDDMPACGEGVQSRKIRSVSGWGLAGLLPGAASQVHCQRSFRWPLAPGLTRAMPWGENSTKKTTAFPMSCWMCFRGTFFCAVNRHRGRERRSWPFLQAAFSGVGIGFCTKGNWFNCLSRNLIGLTLKPEGVSLSHRSKTGTNQLRRGWKMEQIQMKMHVVFILCYKLLIKKYTMYKWVHHSFPVSPQLF